MISAAVSLNNRDLAGDPGARCGRERSIPGDVTGDRGGTQMMRKGKENGAIVWIGAVTIRHRAAAGTLNNINVHS